MSGSQKRLNVRAGDLIRGDGKAVSRGLGVLFQRHYAEAEAM